MDRKEFLKDNLFVFICASITFVAILASAIIFKQNPIVTLPLFISLFVMFLNARVSRYAFLVGGLNSILYAVSYLFIGLYAMAINALVISFPLQIITFINWNKRTEGGITALKKMKWKWRILLSLAFVFAWVAMYVIFSLAGSPYLVLDNTAALIGITVTVLSMLRFSEYAPLNLVSVAISLVTHTVVFLDDPSNITYVIYTLYSGICIVAAMIRMNKKKMIK